MANVDGAGTSAPTAAGRGRHAADLRPVRRAGAHSATLMCRRPREWGGGVAWRASSGVRAA